MTAEFLAARYRVVRNRGQLQQPHRAAAVAHRAEAAAGDRRRRAGDESRRRNQHAGPRRRAGRAGVDQRRRRASRASSPRSTRSPTRRRRSSRARRRRRCSSPTPTTTGSWRASPSFAGRVVTFGIDRDADVRAIAGRRSRRRRHERPRRRRRAGASRSTTPLVGRGNLANVLAATAVALEFDVPLDGDRRTRAARCGRRRTAARSCGCANGVTVIDDSYNANPTATQARARGARDARTATRRVAVLGEMLELGDSAIALHEDVGRAAAARASTCCSRSAARRRRRWPRRRSPPGWPARTSATSRPATRPPTRRPRWSQPGDLVLVKGSRGVQHRSRGRSAEGGARLMLLPPALSASARELSVLNVTRYITFRTAAASLSALAISLAARPWLIRKLREFQIGQVIRQEGPTDASAEGRHADDGRAADPDGGARADAALGGPDERLRLDRGADDGRLRRDRLRRRLPEDRPPLAPRPAAALQDGLAGPDRHRRRRRAARAGARRRCTTRGWSFRSSSGSSPISAGGTCRSRCSCWSPSRTP